ncbi:MAG: hypothetical protein Q8P34_20615 [Bacteroidota bacterium]|nr:hypothetical protein [Bacteroidota bacterium]
MTSGQSQYAVTGRRKDTPLLDNVEKIYFVVEDVVSVLTDSNDPKQYVKRMRQRDKELAKGWVQFVPTLWQETAGGKQKKGRGKIVNPQL